MRLEQQLNKSKEIKDIWSALEMKADLNNSPATPNRKNSNMNSEYFMQELRRIEVSLSDYNFLCSHSARTLHFRLLILSANKINPIFPTLNKH